MKVTAAVVREQGVNFAVVLVRRSVLLKAHNQTTAVAREFASWFPGNAIILCAQDGDGTPAYFGRPDIVRFLSGIHLEQLPWREFTRAA